MPSDVTGSSIYNQRTSDFEFRPGPIFTNLLLADEINRAPPKTQAALLEAMQERQVTIEGLTTRSSAPFLVIATQNPIEYEGTYPLPEAQLDRFLLRIGVGYPSREDEWQVLERRIEREVDEVELEPVVDRADAGRDAARPRAGPRRRASASTWSTSSRPRATRGASRSARALEDARAAQASRGAGRASAARLRHAGGREGSRRARARAPADAAPELWVQRVRG